MLCPGILRGLEEMHIGHSLYDSVRAHEFLVVRQIERSYHFFLPEPFILVLGLVHDSPETQLKV